MNEERAARELLSASIPGESLTAEPKLYPWQNPPELTTVGETISFYSQKISEPKAAEGFVALLDSGISIKTLVDSILDSSVMHGIHTIDVGVLVSPVLVEMFMYMAELNDVVYNSGLEEDIRNPVVEKAMKYKILKEFSEKIEDVDIKDKEEKEQEPVLDMPEEPMPTGLMSRPTPAPILPIEEPVGEVDMPVSEVDEGVV
tara:strand:+ start:658 stop:1260 length:603 start_codon:yes stop_codon:yes gene_type:complete